MSEEVILPRKRKKEDSLSTPYTLMMTKKMHETLQVLSLIEEFEVPDWIRRMIEDGLKKMGKL